MAYDRAHPNQTLLVTGLSTDQFYAGFVDLPFETFGMKNVFIAPGGGRNVNDTRGFVPLLELPPKTVQARLLAGKAAVLDVSDGQVRDVTGEYTVPTALN